MSIAALVAGEDVVEGKSCNWYHRQTSLPLKGKMRIMSTSQGLQKIV